MAPARREALLAWAGRCGAIVVEDDYDGEFRFGRRVVIGYRNITPHAIDEAIALLATITNGQHGSAR
jgi:GntR family transcriptional regulator/MocR family aminotransferase